MPVWAHQPPKGASSGYAVFPLEAFGGLRLADDPQDVGWAGAIDLLNVDFDRSGRVRQRDGFDNLTSAAAAGRYLSLATFESATTRHVLAARSGSVDAVATSGVITGTQATGLSSYRLSAAMYGGPSATVAYVAIDGTNLGVGSTLIYKWNGSAWSSWAWTLTGEPSLVAVQPTDNRLVVVTTASGNSRVYFSDPGAPETVGSNDYVDLLPGDGQVIHAIVSWRDQVFAFKGTRFFVFYGNSTDATGGAVFNFRTIDTGIGPVGAKAVAAGRDAVYFVGRDGIYRTSGGAPQRISGLVEPLWTGATSAFFASSAINPAALSSVSSEITLACLDDRLYMAFPSGSSTTNDRLLVHDLAAGSWTLWDLPAAAIASFRVSTRYEPVFAYAAGANHVGRVSSSFTTDDGAAVTSRYRTGFSDLGTPGTEKVLREVLMDGAGTVRTAVAVNDGSLDTAKQTDVTLGTALATGNGRHRKAYRGRNFSVQFSSVSGGAWTLNRAIGHVHGERGPGVKSA
jgi:hypothetical protein